MGTKELIEHWFATWERGDFMNLPISHSFRHTSPFGTIDGKKAYLDLVQANKDKFLGYRFEQHDALYEGDRACVRYTGKQDDFSLEVSEWYYIREGLIDAIVAYYHIGEIRDDRKLSE